MRIHVEWKLLIVQVAVLAPLALSAGCHAPMPTMKSIQPYDASRVPPPGTGSFANPSQSQYYPGANGAPGPLPGVSVSVRPTSATVPVVVPPTSPGQPGQPGLQWQNSGAPVTTPVAPTVNPVAPATGAFTPAAVPSAAGGSTAVPTESPVRIVESTAVPAEPAALRGMPVNNAVAEPAAFQPQGSMIPISQLPASP